jgi:hypothetical protein
LANPLGAAIGQLVDSEWATKPSDIPDMVLYISIIVSVTLQPYAPTTKSTNANPLQSNN